MVMSYIWFGMIALSLLFALATGNGAALGQSVLTGAQSGITLVISIGGSICLWSGLGEVMERSGLSSRLARLFRPLLGRLFPSSRRDAQIGAFLSANFCANLLGLGNAATPMGIAAVKRMRRFAEGDCASDEMCRLIVMNTASIQLIPANVAAVRASFGCAAPFDILPAVWVTSLCSVSAGLIATRLLRGVWKR